MTLLSHLRQYSLILLLSLPLFIIACKSKDSSTESGTTQSPTTDSSDNSTQKGTAGGPAPLVTYDDLQTLYVENDGSNQQVLKLLNDNNKKKLLFQIYRDREGDLRLLIIPSRSANGKYYLEDTLQPKLSAVVQTRFPDDDDVVLGTLELANKGNNKPIDILRTNIGSGANNTAWKYIWFVPEIKPVADEQSPPTRFAKSYLVYHVKQSDTLPTPLQDPGVKNLKETTRAVVQIGVSNPSPPATMQ